MSENNLINTCVWCIKSFDNAMVLWDHCMDPWCGEWPDNLIMDTSDNAAMDGVDTLTPEQVGVSKNVESSDDSESLFICKPCDKSFDRVMDLLPMKLKSIPFHHGLRK